MSKGTKIRVTRKDKKYNLISPFWLLSDLEALLCIADSVLGAAFSNQIRSIRLRAVLKLVFKRIWGINRWVVVG